MAASNLLLPRTLRISLSAASLLLIGMSFQNCSKASFSTAEQAASGEEYNGTAGGPSCRNELHQVTAPIKMLFLVDSSGSNLTGVGLANGEGSDPNKAMRSTSIQNFLDSYAMKSNFSWGFINFQGYGASNFIGGKVNSSVAFSDPSDMQAAINHFQSTVDAGKTPYRAALDLARAELKSQRSLDPNTKFILVFLSDGIPTDYVDSGQTDTDLYNDVKSLSNLFPNRIAITTVYYGPSDPAASGRLAMMAKMGHGQFLDTNKSSAGKDFQVSDIVNIPGVVCSSAK